MIVEYLFDEEKAIAKIPDGCWMLKNPVFTIQGDFIVSMYSILGDKAFPVKSFVLMSYTSKKLERSLLVSEAPFIVITGNSQRKSDHIIFDLKVPGVVEGDEVSDIPLLDCETDLVHQNVSIDDFSGKFTTLARTIRLAEISSEELFTTYGFLNCGGDGGDFRYLKKDLVGYQIVSEKFYEFDYTFNLPALIWIPHDFALSVVRIANLSRSYGVLIKDAIQDIVSRISGVKSRMK